MHGDYLKCITGREIIGEGVEGEVLENPVCMFFAKSC